NMIEHIFGVLKHHFCILLFIQTYIPAALCAIHNFICSHSPDGLIDEPNDDEHFNYDNPSHQGIPDDNDDKSDRGGGMKEARNCIAHCMWEDYQVVLQQRGLLDDSFNDM
ncbi:hypothetical protein BDR06DRAFT_868760, partial [Suillus hirtellus]